MKRTVFALLFILLALAVTAGNAPVIIKEVPDIYNTDAPLSVVSVPSDSYVQISESPTASTLTLSTAPPAPTPTPVPEPSHINLLAVGDLMCLYAQITNAYDHGEYSFDYAFAEVKDKIASSDLAIGNLETLVASGYKYSGPSPETGSPKLNAPESYLTALKNCGFDVLVTANNHAWDKKADGLQKTSQKLDEYGFLHTGTSADEVHDPPLIVNIKGIKIAVMAYTSLVNGHPKTGEMINRYDEDSITKDMEFARYSDADFIIVYMHWGNEKTHTVNSAQKKQAAFVANAGADIIIGSHPHCIQRADFIETEHGSVPVFYSLGNFISSMGATICRDAFMLNISLEKDPVTGETTLAKLTYTPTFYGGRYIVYPADEESAAQSDLKSLESSRKRTIKVLGDSVALPE